MKARHVVEAEAKDWINRISQPYKYDLYRQEFIDYLENTLIPSLRDSGSEATAEEFELGAQILKSGYHPSGDSEQNLADWVSWLQNTWIPDLRQDGYEATADDVDTLIRFLHGQGHPDVRPQSSSYDLHPHRRPDDEVEESAKDFILSLRPRRLGDHWELYISGDLNDPNRSYDAIPVELTWKTDKGYFPNTQDGPYNLAADVSKHLKTLSYGDTDEAYSEILGHYFDQIYQKVAEGIFSGDIDGSVGPRKWELSDVSNDPF